MAIIEKGQKAPSFDLTNQRGEHVKLEDFKGKNLLLSWHPLAFTPVCTDQMRDLEANYEYFQDHDTDVVGISVDPQPTKKAWAVSLCLGNLDILSDFKPLGEVSKAYGIWKDHSGASGRAVVLIGPDGTVLWSHEYEDSIKPDIEKIKELVANCKRSHLD